jgi:hypothetical protein
MKIERHLFETYLEMIRGSVGTKMFQHFYATFDGERRDTMNGGYTACAFYVSSILTIFGWLKAPNSVVESVVAKLEETGWQKVAEPEDGDVLVYEEAGVDENDPEPMPHIGFYIGNERAISNSSTQRVPIEHDWRFRETRERTVTAIYRGKHLMPDNIKIVED